MAHSTVVGLIMICLVALYSLYLLNQASNSLLNASAKQYLLLQDLVSKVNSELIRILNVTTLSNTTLRVWVANNGTSVIMVSDVTKFMDVMLVYNSSTSRELTIRYFMYGVGEGSWSIVYVVNDFLNPIDVQSGRGGWDPGEILVIEIRLPTNEYFTNNTRALIVMSSPHGSISMRQFLVVYRV